jgi:hypothetical protein
MRRIVSVLIISIILGCCSKGETEKTVNYYTYNNPVVKEEKKYYERQEISEENRLKYFYKTAWEYVKWIGDRIVGYKNDIFLALLMLEINKVANGFSKIATSISVKAQRNESKKVEVKKSESKKK